MTPSRKIIFTVFIWALLTGAVFGFVLPKLSKGLIDLQASHEKQIAQLKDLQEQVQALKKIQEDLNKIDSQEVKPTDLFTSDIRLVNEIKKIESYAQKAGLAETLTVTGTADKAQAVASKSGLSQVPYTISLKGPFPGVVNFILYLENSSFISPVNAITVLYTEPNNVTASILTNFYIYR